MVGEIESARRSWRLAIDDAKFWRRRTSRHADWTRGMADAWDRHDRAIADAVRHFRRYHQREGGAS